MKHRLVSLLLVLPLAACGEPPEDESGNGPGRGGASGFGGSGPTGGSSGSGVTGGSSGAGGSGDVGGSSGGGTAGSAAASGSGGDPSECNLLPADAPDYEVTYDAGPAPAGKGGTVVDGTYFATGEIWYDMLPGPSVTLGGIRIELAGTTWQEADGWPTDDVVNPDFRLTRYFTAEGTSLIVTQICPTHASSKVFRYTAEGDALTVYVYEDGLTYAITFTRQ